MSVSIGYGVVRFFAKKGRITSPFFFTVNLAALAQSLDTVFQWWVSHQQAC
ncbi:MAG: hypothetical protein ACI9EB_001552 [Pseudomonas sp.]|jgi:hypothetical protein